SEHNHRRQRERRCASSEASAHRQSALSLNVVADCVVGGELYTASQQSPLLFSICTRTGCTKVVRSGSVRPGARAVKRIFALPIAPSLSSIFSPPSGVCSLSLYPKPLKPFCVQHGLPAQTPPAGLVISRRRPLWS